MKKAWKLGIPIILVATVLGCAQSETTEPQMSAEPESPAAAETADPAIADTDHYTVEFENDRVRVLRVTYGASEESVMHYHPDHVGVFLNDQQWGMELADGTTQEIPAKAGEHVFAPAGEHLPRNTGDQSAEVVVIELKDGSSDAADEAGPDAIEADADHYAAEFENERVRVLRITYGPGEESVMHYHPDSVAVFLTDQNVVFEFPDGTSQEAPVTAGEHVFSPAGQHLPKNIGDEPLEVLLVELK